MRKYLPKEIVVLSLLAPSQTKVDYTFMDRKNSKNDHYIMKKKGSFYVADYSICIVQKAKIGSVIFTEVYLLHKSFVTIVTICQSQNNGKSEPFWSSQYDFFYCLTSKHLRVLGR